MYALFLQKCATFVTILSEREAVLIYLKWVQKTTGDNEGPAPLHWSCRPLVGKDSVWMPTPRHDRFWL